MATLRRRRGGRDSPEQPGVGGQSGDGDADVVVHVEDLLLVGGQFRLGSLRRHETIRHRLTLVLIHIYIFYILYNNPLYDTFKCSIKWRITLLPGV